MDDVYAINVAKSKYRDGFNGGDVDLVLSVFAPEFTDMSDGRPSRYSADAGAKLRSYLADLFTLYDAKLNVIIVKITVFGDAAFDYGWHELALTPKGAGGTVYRRTRYLEIWNKQASGDWRITKYMDNSDLPDTI